MVKGQGGLSNEVWKSSQMQNYVKDREYYFGYVGDLNRTRERDKIVEEALRRQGLGNEGIAEWLTSTSGRHLMDSVDRKTSDRAFKKMVERNTRGAFLDVTIWSHPDNTGTLDSRIELIEKLKKVI